MTLSVRTIATLSVAAILRRKRRPPTTEEISDPAKTTLAGHEADSLPDVVLSCVDNC